MGFCRLTRPILFSGTTNGIKLIRNLFDRLSKKVHNKQRKMEQPGIKSFLTANAGKEALTSIEESTPCLILQKTTKLITTVESFNEGVRCSEIKLPTGQKVSTYQTRLWNGGASVSTPTKCPGFESHDELFLPLGYNVTNGASAGYVSFNQTSNVIDRSSMLVCNRCKLNKFKL